LVTVDSNWRWMHETAEAVNCYTGNLWNTSLCPDEATCTSNCVIEGADEEYSATYGIRASDAALELTFVTAGEYSRNVGSRTYLMEDENTYKMFKLKNKEARPATASRTRQSRRRHAHTARAARARTPSRRSPSHLLVLVAVHF
jgi:hypothetical protein